MTLSETVVPTDVLVSSRRGAVATLTLNRPAARNALSLDLLLALRHELGTLAAEPSVRAVVLAGNGSVFCAGHDLKEMRAHPEREFQRRLFTHCSEVMLALTNLPQPVIARVQGVATAAGCQLVATCDLAVAADTARFATPGVNIGLFCSTPMVALSRAVGRKQALEMLLTGDMVNAERARELGLVNRVVSEQRLDEEVESLAQTIAEKSSHVVKIGKEAFYRQLEMGLEEAYGYAAEVMTENMMARDAAEGIDAFLGKRAPRWSDRS
jgi:enoyl-CoA hydratase/carnithine racemase